MRNPFKHQPRPADKPSLRERASNLRAGLARLLRQPDHAEADRQRRAVLAGSVAASLPLPVLALSTTATAALAAPVAAIAAAVGSHPDQALLDAEAALIAARDVEVRAKQAFSAASKIVRGVEEQRPVELVPTTGDWTAHHRPHYGGRQARGVAMRYIPPGPGGLPEDHQRWMHIWTGEGLRAAIASAVSTFGRGGQTPHRIRRWRNLLPIADVFDAEMAGALLLSDYTRLADASTAADRAVQRLHREIHRMTATTPEGLAVQIRILAGTEWFRFDTTHTALLRSAAAVAGVALPQPDLDVPAWVAAWERCGGQVRWLPCPSGDRELAFVQPVMRDANPQKRAEVAHLMKQQAGYSAVIDRWLRANT